MITTETASALRTLLADLDREARQAGHAPNTVGYLDRTKVHVGRHLARALGVSPSTLRRTLLRLVSAGEARTYGGGFCPDGPEARAAADAAWARHEADKAAMPAALEALRARGVTPYAEALGEVTLGAADLLRLLAGS